MQIGYFKTIQTNDFIDIEDISNCAIEAYTDDGRVYCIAVKTIYGQSQIFEYGPYVIDIPELPKYVYCSFRRMEYDQEKIAKVIEMFLNDHKKEITQAYELDIDTVLEHCPSIIEYMKREDY